MKQARSLSKTVFAIVFAAVLLAQISFVGYKAHHSGITHDEAYSFFHFGKNIDKALTSYKNPNNNHVLNSIFINIAYKYFNSCEHFIRIHSIIFAVLFSASTACIIFRSINSKPLKIATLGLVLFNWFVFDISYLARGYSIALGAIYLTIAVILTLLARNLKYKHFFWLPAVIISLMNFLALGSMLSSVFILFSINAIFILSYSPCVFKNAVDKYKPVIINLIAITILSTTSLFVLYKNLYKLILAARQRFGMAPFSRLAKQLLIDTLLVKGNHICLIIYLVFVFLTCMGLLFAVYRLYSKIKSNHRRFRPNINSPQAFILLITIGTILTMFIYRNVLKMSLGYMRNGVFLVPLLIISSAILVERMCDNLKNRPVANFAIRTFFAAAAVLLTLQNLPSAHAIEVHTWKQQSVSGPLVRTLNKIDNKKNWRIRLTKKVRFLTWPLLYYRQFDYNYKVVDSEIWDVGVLSKTEKIPNVTYINEDFFDHFDCRILVNPKVNARLEWWTGRGDEQGERR